MRKIYWTKSDQVVGAKAFYDLCSPTIETDYMEDESLVWVA